MFIKFGNNFTGVEYFFSDKKCSFSHMFFLIIINYLNKKMYEKLLMTGILI